MIKRVFFCVFVLVCFIGSVFAEGEGVQKPTLATKGYVDSAVDYVTDQIPDAYTKKETDDLLDSKASSDDVRFNTVPTSQPSGTPPSGQAFIWVSAN